MAKTADELFDTFAARVAEILRERFGMDPEPLLRARRESFTIEGLIRRSDGAPKWYGVQATPEQLQWNGPNATAEAFVEGYIAAFRAADRA
ncbi:MAG TPA: hypothetical protein VL383_16665 [Gemmatimonadaceae bacterium]|jgi:hypothetical protein|nr:hypothetical protein [Gemmatimonadaceae bacterium]